MEKLEMPKSTGDIAMKASFANTILELMVFASVVTSCIQQKLNAFQDAVPTSIASLGNLPAASVRGVVFSPDESKVLTWQNKYVGGWLGGGWTEYSGMQVWDTATDQVIANSDPEERSDRRVSTCLPVFDPRGKRIAYSSPGQVVIWDIGSGNDVVKLSLGENTWSQQLQFLPLTNCLVSISANLTEPDDTIVQTWQTSTWEQLSRKVISGTGMSRPIFSASPLLYDNLGNLLSISNTSGAYEYHDLNKGTSNSAKTSILEDLRTLAGHSAVKHVVYTFDKALIRAHFNTAQTRNGINTNRFGRLEYELETGKLSRSQSTEIPGEVIGYWLDRKKAPIIGDRASHVDSFPLVADLQNRGGSLNSLVPELTPHRLIKHDSSVIFFDGTKLETKHILKRPTEELHSSNVPSELINLDVYKDYALVPQSSKSGAIACYHQDATGLHQTVVLETPDPVLSLVMSRSGNLLAAVCAGYGRGSVELISMPTLKKQTTLSIGQVSIGPVAISDDDTLVAVGGSTSNSRNEIEYVINIYDCKTGESKRLLKSKEYLPSLAFSPDSTRLVAGGDFGKHYIWNLQNDQAPEVLSIDDKETVYDPVSGKVVEQRKRQRSYRSESILFLTDEKAMSIMSHYNELRFLDWEKDKQKAVFGFNQEMKYLRSDDFNRDIVYVETKSTPISPGDSYRRDTDGQLMEHKYKTSDFVALDVIKKQVVKRFVTTFVPKNARLFDLEPASGLILGIEPKNGQAETIFLANGSTGKLECSVDSPMQYVNDAVCLPEGRFIVGGHAIPTNGVEIVNLKSGTSIKRLENQSILTFGSCNGLNYLITRDTFPKTDNFHLWRLEDGIRFASVPHAGLQRVVASPSEERIASFSSDSISVWSVRQLMDGFGKKK